MNGLEEVQLKTAKSVGNGGINEKEEEWDLIIEPKSGLFDINFREVWNYKDLVFLLVKRDWEATHKQSILGPFWTIAQPLFMTVIFSFIFNKVGNISTNGAPASLFYMCGLLPWNFFNNIFQKSSSTFMSNAGIFGKVYFPRLVVPFASVFNSLITFFINFGVFIVFLIIAIVSGYRPDFNLITFLIPVLLLTIILFSLGTGFIISSLTIKYRDLNFLITFGIQLFMYATPIIYPLSMVPEKYKFLVLLNPLASIVEGFRIGFLGVGSVSAGALIYSISISLLLFLIGVIMFNRSEKTFIDSI